VGQIAAVAHSELAQMRLRPRFSLKMLFLLVAVVGVVCAYHVNWIRQRHTLLAESSKPRDGSEDKRYVYHHDTSSTNLLWLFGERGHAAVTLVFDRRRDGMIHARSARFLSLHKQELERAKDLFPEAYICFEYRNDSEP